MATDKPIWKFEKIVSAPLHDLETILFQINEGQFSFHSSPFIIHGTGNGVLKKEGDSFVATYNDGHKSYITIDRNNHTIMLRGQWWYGGFYQLKEESIGQTKITYEVHNVAPSFRWLVPVMTRRLKGIKEGFESFVAGLLSKAQK